MVPRFTVRRTTFSAIYNRPRSDGGNWASTLVLGRNRESGTDSDAVLLEKRLDDVGLQYTARRIEDQAGLVRKCAISLPSEIPAGISFRADYRTGVVQISLVNVDRLDRVTLEFQSRSIDESVLEDLVRLILGRGDAFLHRAPLAGVHGRPFG